MSIDNCCVHGSTVSHYDIQTIGSWNDSYNEALKEAQVGVLQGISQGFALGSLHGIGLGTGK